MGHRSRISTVRAASGRSLVFCLGYDFTTLEVDNMLPTIPLLFIKLRARNKTLADFSLLFLGISACCEFPSDNYDVIGDRFPSTSLSLLEYPLEKSRDLSVLFSALSQCSEWAWHKLMNGWVHFRGNINSKLATVLKRDS